MSDRRDFNPPHARTQSGATQGHQAPLQPFSPTGAPPQGGQPPQSGQPPQGGALSALRQGASGAPAAPTLTPATRTTTLRYTDPNTGEVRACELVSRILTANERNAVARIKANLANGVVWQSLDVVDQARFEALALCAVQLREPSAWLEDAIAQDLNLALAVHAWLVEHDRIFFRPNLGEGEGEAARPRVVLGA